MDQRKPFLLMMGTCLTIICGIIPLGVEYEKCLKESVNKQNLYDYPNANRSETKYLTSNVNTTMLPENSMCKNSGNIISIDNTRILLLCKLNDKIFIEIREILNEKATVNGIHLNITVDIFKESKE